MNKFLAAMFTASMIILQPLTAFAARPAEDPRGAFVKAALDSALEQTSQKKAGDAVRSAFASLDSTEAALAAFEVLFLARFRDESLKSFSEFEKSVEAQADGPRKSEYLQIAAVYSAFVNHALGSEVIPFKPATVKPAEKIPLAAALCDKYRALSDAARNDAKARSESTDFISYLEKKCGAVSAGDAEGAAARAEELAARALSGADKKAGGRAVELARRRYLFSLMVFKAVSGSGDERAGKTAAALVRELFPDKLFRAYFPAGSPE